jgi:hypothetical protein
LIRVQLGDLPPGECRWLTAAEHRLLYTTCLPHTDIPEQGGPPELPTELVHGATVLSNQRPEGHRRIEQPACKEDPDSDSIGISHWQAEPHTASKSQDLPS